MIPTLKQKYTSKFRAIKTANKLQTRLLPRFTTSYKEINLDDYKMTKNLLKGVDVYLIGMMGAGKSTIGRILARKLNYRFFDTDTLIEQVAGKPIPEIFASEGETYFRDLETQILKELSAYNNSAIATGGGIIQKPINWSYLRQGLIIWLDVDLETLKKRVSKGTNRPLAGKLESLLEKRRSLYSYADMHVQSSDNQSPEQVANGIIARIPEMIMTRPKLSNE